MFNNFCLDDNIKGVFDKLYNRASLDTMGVNDLIKWLNQNVTKEDSYYLYYSLKTMNSFSLEFNSDIMLEYILSNSDIGVFKITKDGVYAGRDLENLVLVVKIE